MRLPVSGVSRLGDRMCSLVSRDTGLVAVTGASLTPAPGSTLGAPFGMESGGSGPLRVPCDGPRAQLRVSTCYRLAVTVTQVSPVCVWEGPGALPDQLCTEWDGVSPARGAGHQPRPSCGQDRKQSVSTGAPRHPHQWSWAPRLQFRGPDALS